MEESAAVLKKWKNLIEACKNYYIDSIPTGYTDAEYDKMERDAIKEDNFFVRDYVFETYLKGTKTKNQYIEKIKKEKVEGTTMLEAIINAEKELGEELYCDLKYDGSSIAIYLDSSTGTPKRLVTVGNLNLDNFGVDQTWKLLGFLPKHFPEGIKAIQCEALVDIDRIGTDIDPERARQKANGLINSKDKQDEVNKYLTLRAYRYYTDDTPVGIAVGRMDYRTVIESFETVKSKDDGHILFAPADIHTVPELIAMGNYCENDRTKTTTGTFLNDGWVLYNKKGQCLKALKYAGAGSETDGIVKTKVIGIQWNNQSSKGKDSWSANVLIEPVTLKGSVVRKPSAGSVGKLIKKVITPGAEVSIILANSTIPMVGEVFKPGNGDFMWPTCSCGYHLSEKDTYGSNLKCGNPLCSERVERMKNYISKLSDIHKELDLNKFLVIDRFKWEDTDASVDALLSIVEAGNESGYHNFLLGYMTTDLQKRNLELVWKASYEVLKETYLKLTKG